MTPDTRDPIHEDRLWSDERWMARVIKNEDDDGWAETMFMNGQAEARWWAPGPWGATRRIPSR